MTGRNEAVKNDVGSQLALMECKPRHNTVDARHYSGQVYLVMKQIFRLKSFYTFIRTNFMLFVEETNYKEFRIAIRNKDGEQAYR